MSISAEYNNSLSQHLASALRRAVAANPTATAADMRALVVEYPGLAGVSLAEVLHEQGATPAKPVRRVGRPPNAAKAAPAATAPVAAPAAAAPAAAAPATGGVWRRAWNVRNAEGRAELETAVLEGLVALGGKDVAAASLRKRLGATPQQLRTVLNRHIEMGLVRFTGQARGTRYSLV